MSIKVGKLLGAHEVFAWSGVVLGVAVLFGWYTGTEVLIQVHPTFVPMQYNTALGFLLSGAGLVTYLRGKPAVAMVLGTIVTLIGVLTLYEYIARVDIGIDQLFMTHYIDLHTPNPGRMAPNTALCFSLTGVSIILMSVDFIRKNLTITILGALIAGLGAIALFGYITQLVPAFGWGKMTRMAAHTAFGFMMLGSALLITSHQWIKAKEFRLWLFASVTPLLFSAFGCLYLALSVEHERKLEKIFQYSSRVSAQQFVVELDVVARSLARIADRWTAGDKGTPEQLWQADTQTYLSDYAAFDAILKLREDQQLEWRQAKPGFRVEDLNWIYSGIAEASFQDAIDHRVTFGVTLEKYDSEVLIFAPLKTMENFDGWLIGFLNKSALLNSVNQKIAPAGIRISDLSIHEVNHQNSDERKGSTGLLVKSIDINILDKMIVFTAETTPDFNRIHRSPMRSIIFVLMAVLSGLALWLAIVGLNLRDQQNHAEHLLNQQRNTFNAMIDGLVVVGERGNIMEVNRALLDMFGYSREQVVDNNVAMLMRRQESEQHDDWLKAYRGGTKPSKVIGQRRLFRALRANGDEFPIHLQVTTYRYNGEHIFIGVIDDLSSQMERDARLAETEAILNTSFSYSQTGLAIENKEKRFIRVNESLANWLGYTVDEMVGMLVVEIAPEDEKSETDLALDQMLANNLSSVRKEKQYQRKDGTLVWGLLSASVVTDENDEVTHIVAQIIDISEQKQLEHHLQQQNTLLESVNEELEQFAYAASHDLKEPLRTLKTFTNYLINDLDAGNTERVAKDKEFINNACDRMTSLIDDLLQLSQASNKEYVLETCDLNALVGGILVSLQVRIGESQAQIHVDEEMPRVEADMDQLGLALQNLIQNALKFHRENEPPVIRIGAGVQAGFMCIHVEDNGIGIAKAQHERIFGIFKKLHTNKEYSGTGMGLAIVNKIVTRHDGFVTVESDEGLGARFTLHLPLK